MSDCYDVIVVGGGHAGAEAAWAAARLGCRTALVTMSVEAIGRMSCNPAIGGVGKGHMVREIDALGGLMGLAADAGGIQFRMLNRSKGPAVWAHRAQADRTLYARAVQAMLESVPSLEIIEGIVDDLLADPAADRGPDAGRFTWVVRGVRLADGRALSASAVIVTAGTFLRGLMHCGSQKTVGGRIGEPAANRLSESLERLGLILGRLKTGTPPRIESDSIDRANLAVQTGEEPVSPFSFLTDRIDRPQIDCWITSTNAKSHELIRANIARAPMFSGQIQSRGPRYCPSIEDKVMRFPERDAHQIFLEPEGYDSAWVYCNGIATSLPIDVQEAMVHSIVGLERARIAQYGYAIEYDWVPTDQIDATLETKRVAGLFLAGQVNGTSGYEEAAAQGLMAALNAVARLRGRPTVVLGRDEAYIGVMIDDLVTRPPDEPYRMFTSRAEYRLHLRSDNADIRLTPLGRRIGLVDDARWARFETKKASIDALTAALQRHRHDGRLLIEWLARPEVQLETLCAQAGGPAVSAFSQEVRLAVQIAVKYAGYLAREQRLIARGRQMETRRIPVGFDYGRIAQLRHEAREKLARFRPHSLGQAARISGISPADIATLSLHLAQWPA